MAKLLEDLFIAYYDARAGKRNTDGELEFEINYEENLFKLYKEIEDRTYSPSAATAFITFHPVQREIIASNFRDRVVHHLIFNYINPIFEAGFIDDTYSCRLKNGTSYGIKRMTHFIRSCSENYTKDCYILKLDLSGYFMSINHEKLYNKIVNYLLKHHKKCKFDFDVILFLLDKIIFNDYTKDCVIKGKASNWDGLPKNKSLFQMPKGFGLPIGNLTSQLFSNIYLSDFDNYVKRNLKIKYYSRYVDDITIVHENKEYLKDLILVFKEELSKIDLKLHPKKIYLQHYKRGVNFLGTIIKPNRNYIRNRTKGGLCKSIEKINYIFNKRNIDKDTLISSSCIINSYLGTLKHYKTYCLRERIIEDNVDSVVWEYYRRSGGKDKYRKIAINKQNIVNKGLLV